MGNRIAVSVKVHAPLAIVWNYWFQPDHFIQWNYLTDKWFAIDATNDFRVDGGFVLRVAPVNGDPQFDYTGKYLMIIEHRLIAYEIADRRYVTVSFDGQDKHVLVHETVDTDESRDSDEQRANWQMLLDNFKNYVENLVSVTE